MVSAYRDGPSLGWDEDRRAHLRADLDAFYARAYGLTRDGPGHLGPETLEREGLT